MTDLFGGQGVAQGAHDHVLAHQVLEALGTPASGQHLIACHSHPRVVAWRTKEPGDTAAPGVNPLWLLPSGPDQVRGRRRAGPGLLASHDDTRKGSNNWRRGGIAGSTCLPRSTACRHQRPSHTALSTPGSPRLAPHPTSASANPPPRATRPPPTAASHPPSPHPSSTASSTDPADPCVTSAGWRRGRDSNPRYGYPYTRFPSVLLKPLGHLSAPCQTGDLATPQPGTATVQPPGLRPRATYRETGGEGGIRTHGPREGSTVFETVPIGHSGTSPRRVA